MKLLTMPVPGARDPEQLVARFRQVFDLAAVVPGAEPVDDALTLRMLAAVADEGVEEIRRQASIARALETEAA